MHHAVYKVWRPTGYSNCKAVLLKLPVRGTAANETVLVFCLSLQARSFIQAACTGLVNG